MKTGLVLAAAMEVAVACAGCKGGPRADVEDFESVIVKGDAAAIARAVQSLPSCAPEAGVGTRAPVACLAAIATAFGSKTGFHADTPDQASAATAALVIVREGRGEWVPEPDAWLFTLREGTGPGADALRVVVASKMAAAAPAFARALDADAEARGLMAAVARSLPGACETYALLGSGVAVDAPPPQSTADHSPCVQKDLERVNGPKERGRYGYGVWRGAAGALAAWKDAAAALRAGAGLAEVGAKAVVEGKIGGIDSALTKVALKELPAAPDVSAWIGSDGHEVESRGDAGAKRK